MKKVKVLVASVLCSMMGYVSFTAYESMTITEAERFMKANLEALTNDESGGSGGSGWVYCRCHDDQHCYVGNMISFRPACVKLLGASDCDKYSNNCPSA